MQGSEKHTLFCAYFLFSRLLYLCRQQAPKILLLHKICRAEQPSGSPGYSDDMVLSVVWFADNPQPSSDEAILGPFPRMLAQMAACLSVSCHILNMFDLALREGIQSQLVLVGAQTGFTPSSHNSAHLDEKIYGSWIPFQ